MQATGFTANGSPPMPAGTPPLYFYMAGQQCRHYGFSVRDFGLVSCRASPAGTLAKLIPQSNASCTKPRYDTRQKACNITLAINQPHKRSTSVFHSDTQAEIAEVLQICVKATEAGRCAAARRLPGNHISRCAFMLSVLSAQHQGVL